MKITRLYTNQDQDSVFKEIDIPLKNAGDIGSLSKRFAVKDLIFRETGGDYDYDFHNAPERQFIFMLDSAIEIETSRGEKRQFKGGDILLVEDINGKGHKTRSIDSKLRRSVFVTLGEEEVVGEGSKK
jgi:hypothetical protein